MGSTVHTYGTRGQRRLVRLLVAALGVVTMAGLPLTGSSAQEPTPLTVVSLEPVADTSIGYHQNGSGSTVIRSPRGDEELLDLSWKSPAEQSKADGHELAHVLMAFDLDDLPMGTVIESASLELEVIGQSSLNTGLSAVGSAWDEATTWDTRPTYEDAEPDLIADLPARSRTTIDVTDVVSAWLAEPASNHGLALTPSGAGRHVTKLASKDHANEQLRPQLRIEAAVASAPVEPIVDCVERAPDGSFRVHFGYDNRALDASGRPTPFDVPVGDDNRIDPAMHEPVLPDHFEVPYVVDGQPGRTAPGAGGPSAFVIDGWDGVSPLSWHLLGQNATATTGELCSDALPPSPSTRIRQAFDRGELTVGEAAVAHLLAALNPAELAPEFRPADGDVELDPTWWWVGEAWDDLTIEDHAAIDALLTEQDEQTTMASSEDGTEPVGVASSNDCGDRMFRVAGHPFNCRAEVDTGSFSFEVLYLGDARTPAVQLVIDEAIVAIDHYTSLGFEQPSGFRILLSPLQTRGGLALPGTLATSGTVLLGTSPGPSLVHHELFHQVQYRYIGWTRLREETVRWWLEATAEWGTHQLDRLKVSPTVGYASELDRFLATPAERLDSTSDLVGGREYGAFILGEYLDRRDGGAAAIVRTWETIGAGLFGKAPIDAVHDELTGSRSLTEFWVWSYVLSRDAARGVGFADPDVPVWRDVLQTNPETSAATSAAARPARADTRTIMPTGTVGGDAGVAPGGAAYVDLNIAGTGTHVLSLEVSSRSRAASDLHVAAIPFGDYPALCGPVRTGRFVDGALDLEVVAGSGCSSVTLAFVNGARPQRFGRGNVKLDWQVGSETRSGNDTVFVAGLGNGHDANAYVDSVLTAAGYQVERGPTLPEDLSGIGQVWWIDWDNQPTAEEVIRLEEFVNDGGGLYLTGERPCCEALNQRVSEIVNQLVLDGPVQIGGLGDPFYQRGTLPTNPDAVGGITSVPHEITGIHVDAPGGMAGIAGTNVLASTPAGVPISAVWAGEDLTGSGRLVVVMDINWLDSAGRGPQASGLVENVALFLSKLAEPPDRAPIIVSEPDEGTDTMASSTERPPTGVAATG